MRGRMLGLLIVATLADVFIAGFPAWVIRPFVPQPPGQLALAMELRGIGSWATLAGLAVIAVCAVWLWRHPRQAGIRRPGRRWAAGHVAVLGLVVGGLCAVAANADYFQWMFHPDQDVRAVPIAQAHWPERAMVLDVSLGGQARAYPIREMGYYHVVNDRLGGAPIAATY